MFVKIITFWVSKSTNQWISLFTISLIKLVTLLPIIVSMSAPPGSHLKFFGWFARCAPDVDCILLMRCVHHQRITRNIVLQLSHYLFSKLNELQNGQPTSISLIILHYIDVCIELWLTFLNVFVFSFKQMDSKSL